MFRWEVVLSCRLPSDRDEPIGSSIGGVDKNAAQPDTTRDVQVRGLLVLERVIFAFWCSMEHNM